VILDIYSVHCQEPTKAQAASIGMNLVFIPPVMTDDFETLQVRVWGNEPKLLAVVSAILSVQPQRKGEATSGSGFPAQGMGIREFTCHR
jgi:hypothetical protein